LPLIDALSDADNDRSVDNRTIINNKPIIDQRNFLPKNDPVLLSPINYVTNRHRKVSIDLPRNLDVDVL